MRYMDVSSFRASLFIIVGLKRSVCSSVLIFMVGSLMKLPSNFSLYARKLLVKPLHDLFIRYNVISFGFVDHIITRSSRCTLLFISKHCSLSCNCHFDKTDPFRITCSVASKRACRAMCFFITELKFDIDDNFTENRKFTEN